MMRAAGKVLLATLLVLCGCAVVGGFERSADGASRLAPEPAHTREAVIQVYGARTRGAKGLFGIHTWVAVKPEGAAAYKIGRAHV